jgi:hypothetical protein
VQHSPGLRMRPTGPLDDEDAPASLGALGGFGFASPFSTASSGTDELLDFLWLRVLDVPSASLRSPPLLVPLLRFFLFLFFSTLAALAAALAAAAASSSVSLPLSSSCCEFSSAAASSVPLLSLPALPASSPVRSQLNHNNRLMPQHTNQSQPFFVISEFVVRKHRGVRAVARTSDTCGNPASSFFGNRKTHRAAAACCIQSKRSQLALFGVWVLWFLLLHLWHPIHSAHWSPLRPSVPSEFWAPWVIWLP